MIKFGKLMTILKYQHFFFAKQGERRTSGDNTDIPTRLAPREVSVLCLSNSKFIKKRGGGKSMYKERGG